MIRRRLAIALIVLAIALAAGANASSGFTAVNADREATVSVVGDERAYVGYDSPDRLDVTNGDEVTLVTVSNRVGSTIDAISVDVDAPPELDVTVTDLPAEVGSGESGTIDARIGCAEGVADASVHVTVSTDGNGVSATIFGDTEPRTITVTCEPDDIVDRVEYRSQANVQILSADGERTYEILYLSDGSLEETTESLEPNSPVRGQLDGTGGSSVVGISPEGAGAWYVHPQFDPSTCDFERPARGGTVTEPTDERPTCE